MFRIFPIQEESVHKRYAEACGAEYRSGWFAFGMMDAESEQIMGMSQFEIGEGAACISDLRAKTGTEDVEAMFILGRSTMSFIESVGVTDCYALPDAAEGKLLTMIGFRPKEGKDLLFCDLTGMFDGHCSGHAVELK